MLPRFSLFLMSVTAVVLGALGLGATFLPQELLRLAGAAESGPLVALVQLLGAVWFGFAMLDWMARESLLGGIYGRPLVVGNLAHFVIAGTALLKLVVRDPQARTLWPGAVLFCLLAIAFGAVLFRHPGGSRSGASGSGASC
jgi:hypothetical protein